MTQRGGSPITLARDWSTARAQLETALSMLQQQASDAQRDRGGAETNQDEIVTVAWGQNVRVSPPATGQTVVFPEANAENRDQTITIDVVAPQGTLSMVPSGGTINGESRLTTTLYGSVTLRSDGQGNALTERGASALAADEDDGAPTDAEYILGQSNAQLPSARVAVQSTEISVSRAVAGVVSWALRTGSVLLSRLQDVTGPTLLGRESGTGAIQQLTGAQAGQLIRHANDFAASVTSDTNNWAPSGLATGRVIFISTGGATVNITGIDGSSLTDLEGAFFWATVSGGSGRVQWTNNSAGSTSGNRLLVPVSGGATFGIGPQEWVFILRNGNFWYVMPCAPLLTGEQLGRRIRYTGEITPTIAATTHNWAPPGLATAYSIKAALTGSQTLTGIDSSVFVDAAAGNTADGTELLLKVNDTADSLTLSNNSVSSLPGNRFNVGTPSYNPVLDPGWCASLLHESNFWTPRVFLGPVADDAMLVNISGGTNIPRGRALSSMVSSPLVWDATNHYWRLADGVYGNVTLSGSGTVWTVTSTWAQVLANGNSSGANNPNVSLGQHLYFGDPADLNKPASGDIRKGATGGALEINGIGVNIFTTLASSPINIQCGLNAALSLTGEDILATASGGDMVLTATNDVVLRAASLTESLTLDSNGLLQSGGSPYFMQAQSATSIFAAGHGVWWTESTSPTRPKYRDSIGQSYTVAYAMVSGNTALGTVIAATTALNLTGTFTAPANSSRVGTKYRMHAIVQFLRGGTATALNVRVSGNVAGVEQATTGNIPATTTAGQSGTVNVEMILTVLSLGAGGTAYLSIEGNENIRTGVPLNKVYSLSTAPFAFDTTVNNTLNITAAMGSAVAGTVLTNMGGYIHPL